MKDALRNIKSALQPFAVWHIDSLCNAFENYKAILLKVSGLPKYCGECELLIANLSFIAGYIEELRAKKTSTPYNFASVMLALDLESLISICEDFPG